MNKDDLFRQALQRQNDRAAGMKMPYDMEQRVMERIKPEKTSYRWWYSFSIGAVAASILLLLTFHFIYKNIEPEEKPVIAQKTEQRNSMTKGEAMPAEQVQQQAQPKVNELPPVNVPEMPVTAQKTQVKHNSAIKHYSASNAKSAPTVATDQLHDYIARLEAEMEAVDDSVRSAHLEKIIAADSRLQRLVNRIVKDETEQAMKELQKDSTANYINF